MDVTTQPRSDESCTFYLIKKRRFCRFKPKHGQLYCPEHACMMGASGDRKRIPCPLNPTHNCYEDELEKHIKKCNVTKIRKAFEQSAYYAKGINRGHQPSKVECQKICVKDLTSSQLAEMIERVNILYGTYVEDVAKVVYEHDCVRTEICDSQNEDLTSAFGPQAALKKELLQQASLVGQLDRLSLLTDGNCFVELGAGKGKLSHWIQKATKTCQHNSFILVERSSVRYKMDSFHKQGGDESCFQRIKIDIEDLNLGCVPGVKDASNVIVVGKHLCGGATDMGLRCATHTLVSQPATQVNANTLGGSSYLENALFDLTSNRESSTSTESKELQELTGPSRTEMTNVVKEVHEPPAKAPKLCESKRPLQGIMIALCCHHQCTWDTYSGQEFMQTIGISPENFDLLTRLSSWATCAKTTAKSIRETTVNNRDAVMMDDPKDVSEDHNTKDLINSDYNKPLREQLSVRQREEIGRKCKRLIDTGRLHFLKSKGLQCFLREYIDESITPENVVLIALSSSNKTYI
uniref:tRNA:m(4)X modification enzyme TRM13 n=1 Tax=Biomphalaria glabrata TaxID=6526 RepID=A0A2C9LXY1_BIOGL